MEHRVQSIRIAATGLVAGCSVIAYTNRANDRESCRSRIRRCLGGISVTTAQLMKSHTKYLVFDTKKRREYICLTEDVREFLNESGIKEGFILVSAMHITAGVYINDYESGLIKDIDEWLEKIAPNNPHYHHHQTGEDNGDAHLKRILINHQVMVPVTEGKLDLGPWEQIFYAEFDGQRKKRVILKAIGI